MIRYFLEIREGSRVITTRDNGGNELTRLKNVDIVCSTVQALFESMSAYRGLDISKGIIYQREQPNAYEPRAWEFCKVNGTNRYYIFDHAAGFWVTARLCYEHDFSAR